MSLGNNPFSILSLVWVDSQEYCRDSPELINVLIASGNDVYTITDTYFLNWFCLSLSNLSSTWRLQNCQTDASNKVLQTDAAVKRNALRIGNSQKCTQVTFKDLLYLEEADQYRLLSEMAEGKLTVAELRKRMVSYK